MENHACKFCRGTDFQRQSRYQDARFASSWKGQMLQFIGLSEDPSFESRECMPVNNLTQISNLILTKCQLSFTFGYKVFQLAQVSPQFAIYSRVTTASRIPICFDVCV